MTKVGVVMSTDSPPPIVLFIPIDYDFFRQKRIAVAYNGSNIKIVPNVATHNSIVMALAVKISEYSFVIPIFIMVYEITGFRIHMLKFWFQDS
jgi:hypothetical protein